MKNVMREEICSFELAKLAKEKGFDMGTVHYYTNRILTPEEQEAGYNFSKTPPPYKLRESFVGESDKYIRLQDLVIFREFDIGAPTHSSLHVWLRENHNILVCVYSNASGYLWEVMRAKGGSTMRWSEFEGDDEESGAYTTYERAMEDALEYGLSTIR
jgi:hypothetical protein